MMMDRLAAITSERSILLKSARRLQTLGSARGSSHGSRPFSLASGLMRSYARTALRTADLGPNRNALSRTARFKLHAALYSFKVLDMVSPTLYSVLPFLRSQIAINIPERHRLQHGVVACRDRRHDLVDSGQLRSRPVTRFADFRDRLANADLS